MKFKEDCKTKFSREEQNYKFTKKERLRLANDFKKVYEQGKAYQSKKLVLFVLDTSYAMRRIGFVAGKKVGKAVKRNKVKRLLREVYRLNKHRLISGIDLVVVAKREAAELGFKEIEEEILRLSKKAGLIRGENKEESPSIN